MCHVDSLKVAKKDLPFPSPLNEAWKLVSKVIDRLHLRNHVDPKCKQLYNADDKVPEQFNTMACEQTFVWANLCVGQPFQKDYLCNASHTSVFLSSSLGEVSEPLH
jgi:hypothetical protein